MLFVQATQPLEITLKKYSTEGIIKVLSNIAYKMYDRVRSLSQPPHPLPPFRSLQNNLILGPFFSGTLGISEYSEYHCGYIHIMV